MEAISTEQTAEFDYICDDCKEVIKVGEEFRLISKKQVGRTTKTTFERYHLPSCPIKKRKLMPTRRIHSRYASK